MDDIYYATIDYLAMWEQLYNQDFNRMEFQTVRNHTDAVKKFLITPELTPQEMTYKYASEADVLNKTMSFSN